MEAQQEIQRKKIKHRRKELRNWLAAIPFLLPSIVVFMVFIFIPLVRSVILSMYGTNPIGQMTNFVGFKYYERLFTSEQFLNSLFVTLKFVVYTVPGVLVAGLILSTLGNLRLKGISFFRIVFSLTISISGATAALLF